MLIVIAIAATLGYVGWRGGVGEPPARGWVRAASAAVPGLTVAAGAALFVVVAICNVGDVFSVDTRRECDDLTTAATLIFYGYLALVGFAWLASVRAGFRAGRGVQERWLRLAVALMVGLPVVALAGVRIAVA
jgi:hypothetical protein